MANMKRATRMLLMRDGSSDRSGYDDRRGGRMEYGGMNYEPEDRFRDRRGREHYDNGRFAPMRNEGGYGPEMRWDNEPESRRGRRSRSEYNTPWKDEEYWPPYPGPVYEGEGMNRIGFDRPHNVLTLPMGNMEGSSGSMERGHGGSKRFREEMAEEWTEGMHNEDGSKGPHWKMEDVHKLMKQRGIQTDPNEFFAVLNAVYSDYCGVAKKHGVNNMDFYVDFALAWLNDKDAVPNKAAAYYEYIVK